jgi:hypothetical protein
MIEQRHILLSTFDRYSILSKLSRREWVIALGAGKGGSNPPLYVSRDRLVA